MLIIRRFEPQRTVALIESGLEEQPSSSSSYVVVGDSIDVDEQVGPLNSHEMTRGPISRHRTLASCPCSPSASFVYKRMGIFEDMGPNLLRMGAKRG
jgi:hypothetical protein